LVDMIVERRVIPFIGSGFSAALNLPQWDALLARIATEIEDAIPYDEIKKCCNGDPLQIAEYFFLKSDRSIGPLRHRISVELQNGTSPLLSPAHIELVNLGAPQIYTTNYDDMIESTFRGLDVPVNVVALPKHVATSDTRKTQVVKYHGDLRHEATLVLTESSYYTRLDFESPMDLKFRSDLLGRSVLFMGYSFRDINIRIIWFKLMRMMKDIPQADRPRSYIVRFDKNPVLEVLYDAVGLKTIVLDPSGKARSDEERKELFGRFMLELTLRASPKCLIPGQARPMFVSSAMLAAVQAELEGHRSRRAGYPTTLTTVRGQLLLQSLVRRQIPRELAEQSGAVLRRLARERYLVQVVEMAVNYVKHFAAHPGATLAVAHGLTSQIGRDYIEKVANVPWDVVWGSRLSPDEANLLIKVLRREIAAHIEGSMDRDLAYAVDIVGRIANGQIGPEGDREISEQAEAAIQSASELYSSAKDYRPHPGQAPTPERIITQIEERQREVDGSFEDQEFTEEDIPF
jgi:hypothetical protein